MRSIAVVGAGQAGLLLGIGLLKNNFCVSLYSDRDSTSILQGNITSSQGLFNKALQIERDLGLNFWESTCPRNSSVTFSLLNPNNKKLEIRWKGYPKHHFQAVDQRIKFSRWLNEFENLGGSLNVAPVTISMLEAITRDHDLVIVAAGKGAVSNIFHTNHVLSKFDKPQRILACLYVKGMVPITDKPGIRVNVIPGIGEYFTMPGLTISGACEMMLFEGVPGSAFDCWAEIKSPETQLEKALYLLENHVPHEFERCNNLQLTDQKAVLRGSYPPIIRHPIARLSSGNPILGMADTVVLNDPIAGQGANNASICADIYLNEIIKNSNKSYDEKWMLETFRKYWNYAQYPTTWSNMLLFPPPPYMSEFLQTATKNQTIANTIAQGFEDPQSLFPWITKEETTREKMDFALTALH